MNKSALDKVALSSQQLSGNYLNPIQMQFNVHLKFETFFHPHVSEFIRGLNRKGIPGLLNLTNQTLGNPHLHSPWKFGYTVSNSSSARSACIIEGGFGKTIGPDAVISLPGNFEAVILEGTNLWHYWQDNSNVTRPWNKNEIQMITNQAIGPGCITERILDRIVNSNGKIIQPGNFEVVVFQTDGLHHYTYDNSTIFKQWKHTGIVTPTASGAGCIIQSDLGGSNSALEVVVLEGANLWHYRKNNNSNQWFRVQNQSITDKATGPGCIIQSSFISGGRRNFEVVVLEEGNKLVHYSLDHAKNEWHKISTITDSATGPGWIVQSQVRDSYAHGNFEVIVCEGKQLVHYWKDNSDLASRWRRGQVISDKATGQGCIIHGSFSQLGKADNFEVVTPEENGQVMHYYNVNEGLPGSEAERFYFWDNYNPAISVDDPYPKQDIDFSYGGAYSLYNWEIFFHIPMLIAAELSKNQRFADAMRWYQYIFDPTNDSHELTTHRYWKFLPFRDVEKQRIDHMLEILSDPSKQGSPEKQEIEDQLDDWAKHPFQPHRIARLRLIAYKKNVVMKHNKNVLIAWGDQLFRRDTIESINEATQLYILAANILGPRPQHIPKKGQTKPQTYAQLRKKKLDAFGNVKEEIENEFPYASSWSSVQASNETYGLLGIGETFYFCIPQNDELLNLWDTVADRLFKIRNCMNIEGVVRQLPLFEPPIDPALFVQAAARGVDISSVLSDISAPLPYYRFSYMLQKALEVCSELKSLGAALLSALEKGDAEALASVRARHETEILNMVLKVKEKQYEEATAAKTALEYSRKVAETRSLHYQKLLGVENPQILKPNEEVDDLKLSDQFQLVESGQGDLKITSNEKADLDLSSEAADDQRSASGYLSRASAGNLFPDFGTNLMPWGCGLTTGYGGSKIAAALSSSAGGAQARSGRKTIQAGNSAKVGTFVIRGVDWILQNNIANKDIMQIDKQIAAADIRIAIADQEVKNHKKQIEHAQYIEEFLRDKYTNEELYKWMQGKISTIYFQFYQFGYDLAKRAERCYRFETGLTTSNFIQFGYWDNLNKGLLAGEQLYFALKQMEQAYHDQNKREYEITKNISLVLHDPLALIKLKETGECIFELPEALFDADYPGHYMRRIKSASLTIPCVVGPYTSINCTLTLLANKIRISNNAQLDYAEGEDDSRFVTNFAMLQSIATSHAQNDNGMFELNFRDERFYHFEPAGTISRWRIEMPKDCNAFDFNTISDVVLKLLYTAREGGDLLRQKARAATFVSPQEGLVRMFDAKHEFPNEWYRFLNPEDVNADSQTLNLVLGIERFPFLLRGKEIQIERADLFLNFKEEKYIKDYLGGQAPMHISLTSENANAGGGTLNNDPTFGGMPHLSLDFEEQIPASIRLTVTENDIKKIAESLQQSAGSHQRLNKDAIDDLIIIFRYSAQEE